MDDDVLMKTARVTHVGWGPRPRLAARDRTLGADPRGGRSAGEGGQRVPGTLGHQTGSQRGPSAAVLSQSTLPELRNNGRGFSAFLNCVWLAACKI